jgi:hypothetical protein
MIKKFQPLIIFIALFVSLNLIIAPFTALALDECSGSGSISEGVQCFGSTAYDQSAPTPLVELISGIINVLLSLLGVVFLILIIYGGYTWMTAMGDETKVKKAKQVITTASIGLVIIILSYGIASFVFYGLEKNWILQGY